MRLDVYHHFPKTDTSVSGKLDEILDLLAAQGAKMSALSDAVDAIQVRVGERLAALQQVIADRDQTIRDLTAQLIEAMSNDAADAATIAEKQSQLDAAVAAFDAQSAEIQSQVDELNAAFADVPTGEPTPEGEPEAPPEG